MKKLTTKQFITRSKKCHNNRYDYDLVDYKNTRTKVKIICPEHGEFEQIPADHLRGIGCVDCGLLEISKKGRLTTKMFIAKAREVHGNRYDYSLVYYSGSYNKVNIICPIHGVFEQKPNNHIFGKQGCSGCSGGVVGSTNGFIVKAIVIHGDRYDYSLVDYKNSHTKVGLVCSDHGVFEQTPSNHLSGHGCPSCACMISNQEIDFANHIKSIYDGEIITNTRDVITPYELDVYLPDMDMAFEYNGMYWHNEGITKPIGYHQMKTDMCRDMGVKLYHIWEDGWVGDRPYIESYVERIIMG